jgi:uncharacterized membrane protein
MVWDELAGAHARRDHAQRHLSDVSCLACLIAAVGVVTDSPVTVVRAMVVGPEFGPLAAVALVRRRMYLARRAAAALLVGLAGAAVGDWAVAAQSAAQLAVNLVGIVLAGVLVLWVRQFADRRQ